MKRMFFSGSQGEAAHETGSREDWHDRCEALQLQLEEMTKRNNERNNYINSVFSSMEDGFFLTDIEGRIVLFNKSAEDLLDIHASCLFDESEESHNAVTKGILSECKLAYGASGQKTIETRNANGADIQVSISPVMSKYGKKSLIGMLAIVKDITERKRVENIRKDFVATVSHEFRTPLTLISGFIEMLRMYDNLPPDDKNRSLEILEIETERLKKLISELLLLSKMENKIFTEEPGSIDVATVLGQVITVLRPLAEKKAQTLETSIALNSPVIKGDETWLFHAIHNLVENAIKYTQEGGAIYLEARNDEKELFITVRDNGIGIGPDDLDKIFERFYRVDQSRGSQTGGSGLGLAIAKDIISLFDGSISVSSEQGQGSTFIVRVPLGHDSFRT
ncbi:MAG: ATP-binding protein [Spirochaetales bacterium]|jgi:two-component system phosphate regulon sensor histidine kinase PhoR